MQGSYAQMPVAREANADHFFRNLNDYKNNYSRMASYQAIHREVSAAVAGVDQLLDIGNGGIFNYDTGSVRKITAVDLFLGQIAPALLNGYFPSNVIVRAGDALRLEQADASFDASLIVMLLHHLVGETVEQSIANTRQALGEAWRVIKPGGRLILVESCVPSWFYAFERVVFRAAAKMITASLEHPPTLQYPTELILSILRELSPDVTIRPIPLGRWVIQLGFFWPTALTPIGAYLFTAVKPMTAIADEG